MNKYIYFSPVTRSFLQNENENKVSRLKKALYGLKQSPNAWYVKMHAYMIAHGFSRIVQRRVPYS